MILITKTQSDPIYGYCSLAILGEWRGHEFVGSVCATGESQSVALANISPFVREGEDIIFEGKNVVFERA